MTVLRTPVLASGYSTDSGTGGLTAWAVEASGPGPEAQLRAEQTGSVTLGDASWVVPLGNLLAVIGERDSHLWLVQGRQPHGRRRPGPRRRGALSRRPRPHRSTARRGPLRLGRGVGHRAEPVAR
ncbi:MAG: hypothetical protein LKI24_01945 [Acidipropionibacterium sp.]|nr:hypothetical protein [Acidipropionibacterium sp.]